jgi:hypothetical protein
MENTTENMELVQQRLCSDFNIPLVTGKAALLQSLADAINHLINTDFAKLVNILYRIDISEETLKLQLQQQSSNNTGLLIANMIVERELQKQIMRNRFKQQQQDIPDDDKW